MWRWDNEKKRKKATAKNIKDYINSKYNKEALLQKGSEIVLTKQKKNRSEYKKAKDRADEWFSRYIRLKYSFISGDGELYCKCFTCGNMKLTKEKRSGNIVVEPGIELGHWITRENEQVRHHENNARPQCTKCNCYKNGRPDIFERNLRSEIGDDKVDKVKSISLISMPVNEFTLRERAKYYRILTHKLQNELKVKYW